jgi:hypothetical protein
MKVSKTIVFTIVAFLIVGMGCLKYFQRDEEHLHYHAGFRVYIDGQLQDYSDYKYMNFESCSLHDEKKSRAEEQIEKAHLHDGVGDVVHVHRAGAIWGDLFNNIGVTLPSDLEILKQAIEPNSSIVITIGKEIDNSEKVTLEHIKEVEAKSELCGADELRIQMARLSKLAKLTQVR